MTGGLVVALVGVATVAVSIGSVRLPVGDVWAVVGEQLRLPVVAIYQHTTEIMLALGLANHMVGTAYMDSAIRDDLVDAYETVPEIAEESPSREQVLATEPDIVVAGWSFAFEDEAAGSRDALADLGIDSYLSTGSCPDFDGTSSLDLVREDITEIGAIFGVPDRADDLIADIEGP